MKQVLSETGFKFRLLSGREEALYSYIGAARSLGRSNILFFDIGGGSLEFVYTKDYKMRKVLSLPLGGLRLTQLYGEPDSTFKKKSWDRMEARIIDLIPSRQELAVNEATILVGVGGNLRALAKWDQELKNYPFNKLHNYSMKRESLELMVQELSQLSSKEIAEIDRIGRDRAETLTAGAFVIELIMKKLGFSRLTVSTHGLRDGVLASFLDDPVAYHKGKITKTLRKTLKPDEKQRVGSTIRNFVDMLETYDLLGEKDCQILTYGLHWIRNDGSARPESLFYIIMDDESFLSHRDQLIAALSAIEQNKPRSAEWLYQKYKSILKGKKSKAVVEKIGTVLRFLEIVLRTDSKIRFSIVERGSKIRLVVTPGKDNFPETLFADSVRRLGDRLDSFIEYSIRNDRLKSERQVTALEKVEV